MNKLLGQQIGRYKLLDLLGQGGMALVFRAQDMRLDGIVAFKILLPGYQHAESFLKRFEREARALAQLTHPNIVPLLDYGPIENYDPVTHKVIPGRTFDDRSIRGALIFVRLNPEYQAFAHEQIKEKLKRKVFALCSPTEKITIRKIFQRDGTDVHFRK